MKKWLIILLIIVLVFIGIYFYRAHHAVVSPPTVTVKRGNIVLKAQAVGYIKPIHSITVKSQVAGIVKTIYRYEGEHVNKGEKLLLISPAPSPVDMVTAYEAVHETRAVEKSALHDLKRFTAASHASYVTKNYSDYIAAKKAYAQAKLQRILAQQKLDLIKQGETTLAGEKLAGVIVSPIDGYILDRDVDVGDSVISLSSAQSATALFSIANMQDLMFQGDVDEIDVAKIHVGIPAVITVGAMSQHKITGVVTRVSLQSEQQNGGNVDPDAPFSVGFRIEVTKLKIPQGVQLRSGFSATANIKLKSVKNVLTLPERVIHFAHKQAYVLLPADDTKHPKRQLITLGLSDGMKVQIVKGLQLGEKVIDVSNMADADANELKVAKKQRHFFHKKR